MIELFTSSQCEGCDKIKEIFKKENMNFIEINIDNNNNYSYFKSLGVNSVPTIKINNRVIPAPITEDKIIKLKDEI